MKLSLFLSISLIFCPIFLSAESDEYCHEKNRVVIESGNIVPLLPGPDSCIPPLQPPYYYRPDLWQSIYEATPSLCTFDGTRWVKSVIIAFYNYSDSPAQKPVEIYLWEAGVFPGDTIISFVDTTPVVQPDEILWVQFDIWPENIVYQTGMWFGHYEPVTGPPTSLEDQHRDWINAYSYDGLSWNESCYDYLQVLVLDTVPPPTMVEESRIGVTEERIKFLNITPIPSKEKVTISFLLPTDSHLSLKGFDSSGRLVRTLFIGKLKKGFHKIFWNTEGIEPGSYIVSLRTPSLKEKKTVLVVK